MTYQTLLLDRADGVATLTFNRPQALNALSTALLEEAIDAVTGLEADGVTRALLITGAGRAFSSGADLSDGLAGGDVGARLESHFNPLLEKIVGLPFPVVTAVNGAAAGAGCSIALAGDIVLAARSAYFLQAFVNIGLVPDVGATWLLPRLVGKARATAMMMLGERISAAQALEWGLIWQLVDDDALMPSATALAGKLAAGPTKTYALIRQGIRACMDTTLPEALRIERQNQREAGTTGDFMEGVQAFLQKRPAAFTGR